MPHLFILLLLTAALQSPDEHDVVLAGGRVMDPESGLDRGDDRRRRRSWKRATPARALAAQGVRRAAGIVLPY